MEYKAEKKPSMFLTRPGVKIFKVLSISTGKTKNGNPTVAFELEGKPIKHPEFKGWKGATGQRVSVHSPVLYNDQVMDSFVGGIARLADALGVRDKVDEISKGSFSSIDNFIAAVSPVLCNGKYAKWFIRGEQYAPRKEDALYPKWWFVIKGVEFAIGVEEEFSTPFNYDDDNHCKNLSAEELLVFENRRNAEKIATVETTPVAQPQTSFDLSDDDDDGDLPF